MSEKYDARRILEQRGDEAGRRRGDGQGRRVGGGVHGGLLCSSRQQKREHFGEYELVEIPFEGVGPEKDDGIERAADEGPQNPG